MGESMEEETSSGSQHSPLQGDSIYGSEQDGSARKQRVLETSESPDKEDNTESQIEKYAEKINQIEKKIEEAQKNGIEEKENINNE